MPEQRRFSERAGVKPIKAEIQITSMDRDLRVGLWNVLTNCCWEQLDRGFSDTPFGPTNGSVFFHMVWEYFLKEPLDQMPTGGNALPALRSVFFGGEWQSVYDFLEFVAANFPFDPGDDERFRKCCNVTLERELSGYRFVSGLLTPITSPAELA